jgi:hypothetical protein
MAGGAGAGAAAASLAADAGLSAQELAAKTASPRAVDNSLLVAFMEFQSSPLSFGKQSFWGSYRKLSEVDAAEALGLALNRL